MPAERRTEEEILRELVAEREQLDRALAELRAEVVAKRRPAAVAAATIATLVGAWILLRLARRLGGG